MTLKEKKCGVVYLTARVLDALRACSRKSKLDIHNHKRKQNVLACEQTHKQT